MGRNNQFKREEITDENLYSKIRTSISAYQRSHPDKFYGYKAGRSGDSIGGCLFPLRWYSLGDDDYTLLSLADGIVGDVIPHFLRDMDGSPSRCYAWGERHLTNADVVSSDLTLFPFDDDRLFVAVEPFQRGILFRKSADFQCAGRDGAFSRHILVKKKFFDAEIRPALDVIYQMKRPVGLTDTGRADREPPIISFVDSVYLNQEFANRLVNFAKEKGCN